MTYANVVATLALFLAIGGGAAFAASRLAPDSVGTKQLKKGAVTAAKIKNGAVTGSKIDLATLGRVPSAGHADTAAHADTATDAATLQGSTPSAFVRGGGQLLSARRELASGATGVPLFTLPGIGQVSASCSAGTAHPKGAWTISNASGSKLDETLRFSSGTDGATFQNGEAIELGPDEEIDFLTVRLATRTNPPLLATVDLSFNQAAAAKDAPCIMYANAVLTTG